MLNAFVGWYQEKQAGDIVEKLKAGIAMMAIVRSHSLGIT
jgi:H+-transporting ATPase